METLIAVMVLLSLIINMIGIGVVAKNQGFILDKIMSKEQTPKPKKPKCICKELIKTKSIGWCPACKTDYI
jgi:hypothetical protein